MDTSGSIDKKTLDEQTSEVIAIMQEFNAELDVIYADADVCNVQHFASDEMPSTIDFKPKGSGGTDFKPAFEYIDEHIQNPNFVIYFTDLCCSSYPPEPSYPVMWVKSGEHQGEVPFGELIQI